MMKATDVMSAGRNRTRHASNRGDAIVALLLAMLGELHDEDGVLTRQPRRTRRLICVKTLLSPPVIHTPAIAERIVIGTLRMTGSGNVQLSYAAERRDPGTRTAEDQQHRVAGQDFLIGEAGHSNDIPAGSFCRRPPRWRSGLTAAESR
jgi:hypothetical protein